jgi:hypothetical protein
MIFNLVSKTRTVRFKVITQSALEAAVALFEDLHAQAPAAFPGSTVELLYEIRKDNEVYSGPIAAEF